MHLPINTQKTLKCFKHFNNKTIYILQISKTTVIIISIRIIIQKKLSELHYSNSIITVELTYCGINLGKVSKLSYFKIKGTKSNGTNKTSK